MAFGEILRDKRTELGWTKEYISERTHLMVRVIDALETENNKYIPAPIYGRGFIRQYCAVLGLDPQPLLDDYNRQTKQPQGKTTRSTAQRQPEPAPAPIHTGAKRTLPPKGPEKPAIVSHKPIVATREAVLPPPKPEAPTPPLPKKEEPSPLILEGDSLPFDVPPQQPTVTAPTPAPIDTTEVSSGRAALLDRLEKPPRARKTVTASISIEAPRPRDGNCKPSIFGPQRPAPDPPSPQRGLFRLFGEKCAALGRKIKNLFTSTLHTATHPKVERLSSANEPLFNKQSALRALTIFGVLVILTLLVFAFRYVFRHSAEAEAESPLIGDTPAVEFSVRPLTPPTPYFK